MNARTTSKTVNFKFPFLLEGVDRELAPGDYRVLTDEELIEGVSFPVYRRVSTMILVPAQFHSLSSTELVPVDPLDLRAAQQRDAAEQRQVETNVGEPK